MEYNSFHWFSIRIVPPERFMQVASQSLFKGIDDMKYYPTMWNTYSLENVNVQKFIKSTGLHFDIIVVEEFFIDSFFMFAHKYKAPIVTICKCHNTDHPRMFEAYNFLSMMCFRFNRCNGISRWATGPVSVAKFCTTLGETLFNIFELLDISQIMTHFKLVSSQMLPFSDNMSFTERWYNTVITTYAWFVRHYSFLKSEEMLAKKHFAHLAPLPPLYDIVRNVSLILVNSHRAITPPRPSMPSISICNHFHLKFSSTFWIYF